MDLEELLTNSVQTAFNSSKKRRKKKRYTRNLQLPHPLIKEKPKNYDSMSNKEKLYCRLTVPTQYNNLDGLIKDHVFLENCSTAKRAETEEKYDKFNDEMKLLLLQAYY